MVGLVSKSYSPYLLPKLYSVWLKNVPKTYDNEISVRTNRDRPHLFLKSWVTLLFITEFDRTIHNLDSIFPVIPPNGLLKNE